MKNLSMEDEDKLSNKYGDLFKCNICLDGYQSPRVLPCLHSFCERCLENHIKVNVKVIIARYRVFACPTCREEISLPGEGVAGFRRDFRVEQLHDYLSQTDSSNTSSERESDLVTSCQFCEKELAGSEVLMFCRNCDKSICSSCSVRHKSKSIFSDHIINDINTSGRRLSADTCAIHPGENMGYICQDCNIPICSICAMTNHDDHVTQDVQLGLKDAIDSLKFQFKCMGARLCQLKAKMEDINLIDKAVHENLVSQTTAIKKQVKEVMEHAHKSGEDLTQEVTNKCQDHLERVDLRQTDIELSVARMNSLSDLALDLIGRPSGVGLLRSYSDLTSRIDQALEDSLLLNSDIPDVTVRFDPIDINVQIGKVTCVTREERGIGRKSHEKSRPRELTVVLPFCDEEPCFPSGITVKAKFGRLGNSGGEFDSPRDVCFLNNNHFVITDTNNDRLQIFDLGGLLINVIAEGQMKPWGVTSTREGHIAVTDNYEKCVKIFKKDGTFVEKIGKLLCPCGIACNQRGDFVITDFFNTSAFVLDRKGAAIKKFEMRSRLQDRHTCGASRVTIGPDNLIIISDISNCCVKIFNKNGRFMSRVTHSDHMISPQGIAVDRHGNILVADTIKQRILVLKKGGEYVMSLETPEDRMKDVTGLDVSQHGDVIATLMKSNQIRIFSLVY